MNNMISVAMNAGRTLCGTNEATWWHVTFVTNEMKRGRIIPAADGVYALVGEYQIYFFHEDQVVHLSPHISRTMATMPR
jgi:hypothetical protein